MVAGIFGNLWCRNAEPEAVVELPADDLDDLWARWFRPFVGTGQGDGWLDKLDVTDDRLQNQLTGDFSRNVTALCWLAIRPGDDWRQRVVAWQPYLLAAFDKGLIDIDAELADYLTIAHGEPITEQRVNKDLLAAIDFIDDALWCTQVATDLGFTRLALEATSAGQQVSVRVHVVGVDAPLNDPRIPNLIVKARRYRSTDALALFGPDTDWRIVVTADEPVAFKANLHASTVESSTLPPGAIDELAAAHGVLADLFAAGDRVA